MTSWCWEQEEWSEIHLQPNPPVPSIWYLSKRLSKVWEKGSAKRSKFLKSADGNIYYVGGGIAICLLPHYRFSVLSCIFYPAARPKVSALVQDRRKTIVASIYDTTVHVILLAITLIILYFALPTCKLTEFEVSNIIYCMVMAKFSKTKKKSMGVPDFMEGSLTSYKIGDPRVPKILGNWGIYHGSTCLYLTLLDFTWP